MRGESGLCLSVHFMILTVLAALVALCIFTCLLSYISAFEYFCPSVCFWFGNAKRLTFYLTVMTSNLTTYESFEPSLLETMATTRYSTVICSHYYQSELFPGASVSMTPSERKGYDLLLEESDEPT